MTAPTPEQMRALADRVVQRDDGYTYSVPARDLVEYATALRAAADEVDRLRANAIGHAAHSQRMDRRNAKSEGLRQAEQYRRERVERKLDKRDAHIAELENDILKLVTFIEEAPHDSGCQFSFLPEDKLRRCTCWKADAL